MPGIYIHVPFCRQACSYCDFYFVTRSELVPDYFDALIREIKYYGSLLDGEKIDTVYFGGGTPSRLPEAIFRDITRALNDHFDLDKTVEFTVETNPEDISPEWLNAMSQCGITRLSIGVQSFQPEMLRFMHRAHSGKQAEYAIQLVAEQGFQSFSTDVIYGAPGQTDEQVRRDLETLLTFQPPHVSAYSLTIEPRTRLGKRYELGRLKPADDDKIAAQMLLVQEALAKNGLLPYEISNYSLPGHRALHNSSYWCHENYLGLGPSAHGFWWQKKSRTGIRWSHPPDFRKWAETTRNRGAPPQTLCSLTDADHLDAKTLARERIMLGLRTVDGISSTELQEQYGFHFGPEQIAKLNQFRRKGLLEPDEPLRLSKKGVLIADAICRALL